MQSKFTQPETVVAVSAETWQNITNELVAYAGSVLAEVRAINIHRMTKDKAGTQSLTIKAFVSYADIAEKMERFANRLKHQGGGMFLIGAEDFQSVEYFLRECQLRAEARSKQTRARLQEIASDRTGFAYFVAHEWCDMAQECVEAAVEVKVALRLALDKSVDVEQMADTEVMITELM